MESFQVEDNIRKKPRNFLFNCVISCAILCIGFITALVVYRILLQDREELSKIEALGHHHGDEYNHSEYEFDFETSCEEDICVTKGCIITAARLVTNYDETNDPCQDFYEYACGNYNETKSVREGEYVYNPHTEAEDNIAVFIKKTFDNLEGVTRTKSFEKTNIFYQSCMDYERRNNNSAKDVDEFFHNIGLKWPLFDEDPTPENADWTNIIIKMEELLFDIIFKADVNKVNDTAVIIDVGCHFTKVPIEYHLNPTEKNHERRLSFYKNLVALLLNHLNIPWRKAKQLAEDIVDTESQIAHLYLENEQENSIDCNTACNKAHCPPCEESSPEGRHPISEAHVEQLKGIWSGLVKRSHSDIMIRHSCKGNLESVMTYLNGPNKKKILNYIGWRAVAPIAKLLSSKIQDVYNHYVGKLTFTTAHSIPAAKWRECSDFIRREMAPAMGRILEEKGYINEDKFLEVRKRFSEVKNALKATLTSVPWLDNQTFTQFTDKIDKITLQIGDAEFLRDQKKLDDLYEDFEITAEKSFFFNALDMMELKTTKLYNRIMDEENLDEINRYDMERTSLASGSHYDYVKNQVVIDFGQLFTPLFRYGDGLSRYLEYGQNIFLAHEISHAFDTKGINYDGDGNFIGTAGLPKVVHDRFFEFVLCLTRQLPQQQKRQTDNDIADLGSAFTSLAALELHLASQLPHEIEKPLPTLKLNERQMFFLQSAQLFCEIREEETYATPSREKRKQKDRLNSAIKNMEQFGPIFGCSAGTPMNPLKKCNLLRERSDMY